MAFELVARNGLIALNNSIVTGSLNVTNGITGSLFGTSSWANNAATSSFILNAVSASFAATASSADNFLVRGTLTAQTIVAQTITSSTDFVTGSTRFGTLLTNTHVFSGSVTMNPGGLFVSGSGDVSIGTTTPFSTGGTAKVSVFAATTPALSIGIANNDLMYFRRESTGVFTLQTNNGGNAGNILLQPFGGNVGIGTTNPTGALDVRGIVYISRDQNASVTNLNINSGATPVSAFQINTDQPNLLSVLNSRNSYALVLSTNDVEKVRITSGGNVGIGTTSPTTQFHVQGTGRFVNTTVSNTGGALFTGNIPANWPFPSETSATGRYTIIGNANNTTISFPTLNTFGTVGVIGANGGSTGGRNNIGVLGYTYFTQNMSGNSGNNANAGYFLARGTGSVTDFIGTYRGIYTEANIGADTGSGGSIVAAELVAVGKPQQSTIGALITVSGGSNNYGLYVNADINYLSGNVGIGTTSPGTKLDVTGNVRATSFTGSFSGSLTGLASNATTASYVLNAVSASFATNATTASYILQAVSASFATNAVSASFATNAANATTASYVLNAVSASQAATASSADNFLVRGTLTAQTIVAQTITSSTDFVTGSTRFGTLLTNTHVFSGSVTMNPGGLFVSSSGLVGIGTTNPSSRLTVTGEGNGTVRMGSTGFGGDWVGISLSGNLNTSDYNLLSSATNTSFYLNRPNGGDMLFRHNNVDQMIIKSGGNVGIGTTTPSVKLQVVGDGLFNSNTNTNLTINSNGGVAILTLTNSAGSQLIYGGTGGSNVMDFYTNSTFRVRIDASGNVGIGTTSPSARLDIETSSGGYAVVIKNTSAGGDYLKMTGDSGNTAFEFGSGGTGADAFLNMYADNTQKVLVNADGTSYFNGGNVGIGTVTPLGNLQIGDSAGTGGTAALFNGFTGVSHGSLKIYAYGNNTPTIQLSANSSGIGGGTTYFNSGNVGIGTTSPGAKLHISSSTVNDALLITTPNNNSSLYPFFLGGATLTSGDYLRANASIIEFFRNGGPATIRTVGSTNNLVLQSATNLIFNTNGANEYARIDSSGNVGIGTTTPTARLHVSGTTGGVFEVDGAAAVNALYVSASGRIGIGNITPGYTLDVTGNIHSTTTMLIDASNAAYLRGGDDHEWWDINVANTVGLYGTSNSAVGGLKLGSGGPTLYGASGNLGIGTTSPGQALDVNGRIRIGSNAQTEIYSSSNRVVFRGENTDNVAQFAGYGLFLPIAGQSYNLYLAGSANFGYTDTTATLDIHRGNTGPFIRLNSNGTSYLNGGNVGIGTTSPAYKLEVNGATGISGQTTITSDSTEQVTIRTVTNTNRQLLIGYNYTPNYGYIQAVEQGTAFRNLLLNPSGGNVGIGTTSPSQKLNVFGNIRVDGDYVQIVNASSPSLYLNNVSVQWRAYMPTGLNNFAINDSARDVLTLGYNGGNSYFQGCNVGIGTTSPGYPLEIASTNALSIAYQRTGVSAKKWGFQSDNDSTYWYNITDNVLALTVRNTGLIGIGTTSPGEKLHVVGNIKLNNGNAIYLGDSANNNGGRIYVDTGTNNFYINQANNSPLYFATNNGTKATILGNGNFGIGTTNPSYKLHITETTSADCRLQIENTSTGNAGIEIVGGGGNQYIDFTPVASTDFEGRIIYSSSSDEMQFMTNITNRFKLNSNGAEVQNGALGVGVAANSTDGRIDASNDIVAYSSDKRLKTNIQSIENPLDKIGKLSGFTYNWNDKAAKLANYDTNESLIGVFAQEVQAVLPEAVKLAPFDNDGNNKSISGENYLTVQYEKIVPLLIEAIKEQQKQIDDLKYLLSQK